ncbi:unnamed protein product [Cunninghamella echinulata]
MSTLTDYQSRNEEKNYGNAKQLPHLPKGVRIPRLHGNEEKPLPSHKYNDDGDDDGGGDNNMQMMAPGQDFHNRRELQPYHASNALQPYNNNNQVPPPVFASLPKKKFSIRRPTQVQQHIYRMSGGIEPVDLLCDRLSVWRLAIRDLIDLFKNIIDIEARAANSYAVSNKPLNIPFRESNNQF